MKIGDTAPDFELPDLDGHVHRLGDHRGQIVILNFWSCACPHVERTDELILTWWKESWDRDISVLRIASNASETIAALADVAARKRIPLLLIDGLHTVADLYAAQTTPHVFVIDTTGRLRYRGAVDDTSFARRVPTRFPLAEAVRALLAGESPPVIETQPYGCAIIREALE